MKVITKVSAGIVTLGVAVAGVAFAQQPKPVQPVVVSTVAQTKPIETPVATPVVQPTPTPTPTIKKAAPATVSVATPTTQTIFSYSGTGSVGANTEQPLSFTPPTNPGWTVNYSWSNCGTTSISLKLRVGGTTLYHSTQGDSGSSTWGPILGQNLPIYLFAYGDQCSWSVNITIPT